MQASDSIYAKALSPVRQLLIVLAIELVLMIISWAAGDVMPAELPWTISLGLLLFFSLFNTIFSVAAQDRMRYWRDSIFSYVGLMVLGGLMAWAFSGLTISEAGAFRGMYLIITFCFILFLTIINLIRKFVEIAQREDHRLRGGD